MRSLSKAEKVIKSSRLELILGEPFFAYLLTKIQFKEDPTVPTMMTDMEYIYFNPEFVVDLKIERVKGTICHELLHCISLHGTRKRGRDHKKWNMACDYAINPLVLDSGLKLPDGVLVNAKYKDMTAEAIYDKMEENKGAEGESDGYINIGDILDTTKSMTKEEVGTLEQEWKANGAEALQVAKLAGDVPGGIERIIAGVLYPTVNWTEVLQRFFKQTVKNDYTWARPNRRLLSRGLCLPGMLSNTVGEMVIAVDTSCSITNEMLSQFAAEASSILSEIKPEKIHVVYCDTKVGSSEEFLPSELPLELHPTGGGGTRFSPVFRWVEDNGIQPECLVYLTDLQCRDYAKHTPEYPVLWACTEREYNDPPFGDVVHVDITKE